MARMLSRLPEAPKRKPWWLVAIGVVAFVVLVGAGGGAAYLWNLGHAFDANTQRLSEVFPAESDRPPVASVDQEEQQRAVAQNILLLGSDSRGRERTGLDAIRNQRADTIMVVHIPADRESVQVMSIMRDDWVPIPGHGEGKVNAALAYGGVPLAVQTVESLIGVRIDHVAVVDFEGFRGLTDALGGITLENRIGFDSYHLKGHRFERGALTLSGHQALAFVRERYAFADGDYQRVRNQQAFLRAVLAEVLSVETLANPVRTSALVASVAPHLAVDDGLTAGYLAELGMQLAELRLDDVRFFTMPTLGTATSADGQSIVRVDWAQVGALQRAFRTDSVGEYQPPAE